MGFQVFVWTVAALLIISAMGVVLSKNLVHGVFWLAGTLIATAAMYVFLEAPFLAGIQIVLYTGGVITLMLFGVMLTQRNPDVDIPNPVARPGAAAAASAVRGSGASSPSCFRRSRFEIRVGTTKPCFRRSSTARCSRCSCRR